MLKYDLHTHSTASDGVLPPDQLIHHAQAAGVTHIALTDHDGIDGLQQASLSAAKAGLKFINGIELSVSWNQSTVHIVGLAIDPAYQPLLQGIERLKQYRLERAGKIARALQQHGIEQALEGAARYAQGAIIGRMHFARFLVDKGYCKDIGMVFKRFLIKNKPGHVPGEWAALEDVVAWINGAGGIAVIAHPCRYSFKPARIKQLIRVFKQMGGQAIEVISGRQPQHEISFLEKLAVKHELYASVGSDFHNPGVSWNQLGQFPDLPASCVPVWQDKAL